MSDVIDNSADDNPAAQPNASAHGQHDDLSTLLAEFDTSEKSSATATPEGTAPEEDLKGTLAEQARVLKELQAKQPKGFYDTPDGLALVMKVDAYSAFTDATMQRLSAAEQQRAAEDRQRLEREDGGRVLAYAREQLDGYDVPEGWDMRWLASEHAINPEVATAWKNRYASEDAKAHAQHVVEQAVKRMVKDAKAHADSRIDFNATEDRALVSAAVRGSRGPAPAEDSRTYARRVNSMSDFDFAQHKSQLMDR